MSVIVIGDENTVLGFSLVGVQGRIVRNRDAAQAALQNVLDDPEFKLVLITENWAAEMRDEIDRLKMEMSEPLLLEIPASDSGPQGYLLREFVEQALGIRLSQERE